MPSNASVACALADFDNAADRGCRRAGLSQQHDSGRNSLRRGCRVRHCIARPCRKTLGTFRRPRVVQNQPGGGGIISGRTVTNAPADGYTIAWVGNNTAIGVSLFKEPFDPRQDMRPIVGVSEFAYLLVTNASSQFKTLREWLDAARAKPGTLSIGTSSAGTSNHLAALLFKSAKSLDVTVVPYRGPAELSVALLRNDVDLVVNAYGGLRASIEAKQIRPLAVTSASRISELPEVPTMKEAGVPGFEVTSWNGLYGPKDMPQQAVDTIAAVVTQIRTNPM
jgi:tripartite-type tricarboxylate transporter receptor subunit TctC